MKKNINGFTLIELLVVICVVVVLFSILLPVLNSTREKARRISGMNNLRQMGVAIINYANSNTEGYFPNSGSDADGRTAGSLAMLSDSLKDTAVLMDPSSGRSSAKSWSEFMNCDYAYVKGFSFSSTASDSAIVLNKSNIHVNYGNVLFADGHVIGFKGSDWTKNKNIRNPTLSALMSAGV